MTCQEVVAELEALGTPQIKKIWMNYGTEEPCFGVKVQDMKVLLKRVKGDHKLALELYDTGIADAMYFAGLLVNDSKMTEADLEKWVKGAKPGWVADFTVPWVAGASPHARTVALKWIESKDERVCSTGWGTYGSYLSVTPDDKLDLVEITGLLERIQNNVKDQPDPIKLAMMGFVSAVGCYVLPLHEVALEVAKTVGPLNLTRKNNCKVPSAVEYIDKVAARGAVGKKRKSTKC